MNLKIKIFFVVSILLFLFSFFILFVFNFNLKNSFSEKELLTMQGLSQFLKEEIEEKKEALKNQILEISKKEDLFSKDKEKIKGLISPYFHFSDLIFLSFDGHPLFSLKDEYYGRWDKNNYFLLARERKEIVFSEITFQISDPKFSVFVFVPLKDSSGNLNFLILRVDADYFLGSIRKIAKSYPQYVFFVTNSSKRVVFSSFGKFLGETFLVQKIGENKITFLLFDEKFLGWQEKLEIGQTSLILAKEESKIFNPYFSLIKKEIFYVGSIFIVSALFLFFYSYLILSPLNRIILVLDQVLKGEIRKDIEIKRNDEIGLLSDKINKLFKDLQKTQLELAKQKELFEIGEKKWRQEKEILKKAFSEELKEKTRQLQLTVKEIQDSRRAILNVLEDVEEEKRKAELERDKTLSLIESMSDGILLFDESHSLSLINPQAEFLFKIKREEVMNKKMEDLVQFPYFSPLVELLKKENKGFLRKNCRFLKT
jgi:PAS domain-containing protein